MTELLSSESHGTISCADTVPFTSLRNALWFDSSTNQVHGEKQMAKRKQQARKQRRVAGVTRKSQKAVSRNRAEGIRLFALAGRPTREQFIAVYGERGPRMTWDERARAGVSAKQFQAALAKKSRIRA